MSSSNDHVFKMPYNIYRENSALKRWKMLTRVVMKIIREGSCDISNLGQLFINYDLFAIQRINDQLPDPDGDWFEYTTTSTSGTYSFVIRKLKQKLTLQDFDGVDSSGNVCIWPSEEALAFYLLHIPRSVFDGKSVLELGGGMTCLAGLAVAKSAAPSRIELTDGNVKSVENVSQILRRNNLNMRVICSVFEWGVNNSRFRDVRTKVDIIIAADCLYSKRNRHKFLKTLKTALKDTGIAVIFAPQRDNIVEKFEKEALLKGFRCTEELQYNNTIWDKHLFMAKYNKYNAVKHYPILILLTRIRDEEEEENN